MENGAWSQPYVFYTDKHREAFSSKISVRTDRDFIFSRKQIFKRLSDSGAQMYDADGQAMALDEEILVKALSEAAKSFNDHIASSAVDKALVKATQELANWRIYAKGTLALINGDNVNYDEGFYYQGLDAIMNFYSKWTKQDFTSICYALRTDYRWLNQYKDIPFFVMLRKYLQKMSFGQKPNVVPVNKRLAKEFIEDLVFTQNEGKKVRRSRGSIDKNLRSDVVEKSLIPIFSGMIGEIQRDIPEALKSGQPVTLAHSGRKLQKKYNSQIRSDVMTDAPLVFSVQTDAGARVISLTMGFNEKWYKNYSHIPNKKSKLQPFGDVNILDSTTLPRIINELAGNSNSHRAIYVNAYAVKGATNNSNFLHQIEEVERTIVISGLMGSDAKIKGTNTYDVSQFFVVNGKFYSVYDVFMKLVEDQNFSGKVKIKYEGLEEYQGAAMDYQTGLSGDGSANIALALKRSREAYKKFRDIKVSKVALKNFDLNLGNLT